MKCHHKTHCYHTGARHNGPALFLGFVAATIASCLPLAVPAQESDDSGYAHLPLQDLMKLDVFRAASLLPTQQNKAPGTVYSFNRDDFSRLGVRRLDELLQFVPGMQLNQNRKRHQSIWARGLLDRFNDKLVLLIDGVRSQHLYYGHFSLGDNLPLEKIEKVEIIQGPASSLYGANAFGGIISVTTREFSDTSQSETTLEAADNQRAKASFLNNSETVQVFASYLKQDAPFRDDRVSFIGGETQQPLDETYRNLLIKAKPAKGITLTADYQQNDTPFLFIPATQDAFVEERMLNLSALYEAGEVDTGRIEANIYYTQDDTREYEREQLTQSLGYVENQKSKTHGARVTLFKRLFSAHVFALGGTWQNERPTDTSYVRYFHYAEGYLSPPRRGDLLSDPEIRTDDYAVYLQDVWDISPKLTLTVGGRYDEFEVFGGHKNYRGALVYSPNEQDTWKLMYGTAIRTPTYREYLKVLQDTNFTAPIPEPERIHSLELGYYLQLDKATFNITLFNNKVEDYIYEVQTPDGADEYFANSDERWTMYGADALLQYHLTKKVNLRLGAGYLDAEAGDSVKLPYLATWNSSLALDYTPKADHHIGLSLVYNSTRGDTNNYPEDDPGDFLLTNIFASGPLSRDFNYHFGVNNLFNETIYDPAADFGDQYNTEKSEREIWFKVQWSPKR